MSGTIVTQRLTPDISERLAPSADSQNHWPFLPSTDATTMKPPPTAHRRQPLLRSSSFVKLRRFCNQSCDAFPTALLYLTLQSSVSHALVQLKACMLVLSVYVAVTCLAGQLTACLYALLVNTPPPGLVFMVVCLLIIMAAFSHIVVNVLKSKQRGARTRVNFVHKKNN